MTLVAPWRQGGSQVSKRCHLGSLWGVFLHIIGMCLNIISVCLQVDVASGCVEFLPYGPWPHDAITWKLRLPLLRNSVEVLR